MSNQVKETVYETILKVRAATGSVFKAGYNDFHQYKYATANDVIREVREACNANGLLFIPSGLQDISHLKNGEVITGNMLFKVINKYGDSVEVHIPCGGQDKGDKALYKANTGALKYLFIDLFLLPTDDDPESTTGQKPPAKAKPPLTPQRQKPTSTKPWLQDKQINKMVERYKGGEWNNIDEAITELKKYMRISKKNEEALRSQMEKLNG